MSLKIPHRLIAELINLAKQDEPNECCGLLLGVGDEADEIHPMTNVNPRPIVKYTMESRELVEVRRAARKSNRELVAIYHSHTFKEAYPSATDIASAKKVAGISTTHVIISLADKMQPVVRAFSIDGNSEPIELAVETDGLPYRAV